MTLQQSHDCVRCGETIDPGDVFSAVDVLDGDGDLNILLCEVCGPGLRSYIDGAISIPMPTERHPLVTALGADRGVTCVVGAGGKKTTIYTLANALDTAIITATVRIPLFDTHVNNVYVNDEALDAFPLTETAFPIGIVAEKEADRYRGFHPDVINSIAALHHGPVLVKADGARTREFKAPDDSEPQIPSSTRTVVPIASVHAVGEPLTEVVVHRPDRVAELTSLRIGDEIRPQDIATVISHPDGGLKNVPHDAHVIPLLNKVDTPDDEAIANEIADKIFTQVADNPFGPDIRRVVLSQLSKERVVAVRLA